MTEALDEDSNNPITLSYNYRANLQRVHFVITDKRDYAITVSSQHCQVL